MKKYWLSFFLLIPGICSFSQDSPGLQWANISIKIDGNAQDWTVPLKHFDTGTRMFFDFKNDSNNLYMCFQIKDELTQIKILRAGMKTIIGSKINGKHKSTISYPLPPDVASLSFRPEDEERADPVAGKKRMHAAFIKGDTLMEVKGFTSKNGKISALDSMTIHAAINWDNENTLTCEMAIPLKELFGNDYQLKDLSKEISLNVIIKPLSTSLLSKNYHGTGDGRNNPEDGGRMGQAGGYPGGRSVLFQKTELKQKLILARQQ